MIEQAGRGGRCSVQDRVGNTTTSLRRALSRMIPAAACGRFHGQAQVGVVAMASQAKVRGRSKTSRVAHAKADEEKEISDLLPCLCLLWFTDTLCCSMHVCTDSQCTEIFSLSHKLYFSKLPLSKSQTAGERQAISQTRREERGRTFRLSFPGKGRPLKLDGKFSFQWFVCEPV